MSDDRITHNTDGSAIVKLTEAIVVRGETHSRVTIPALKGKHIKLIPWKGGAPVPMGQLVMWANDLVLPAGSVELMSTEDAMFIAGVVIDSLTRSPARPDAPSA